MMFAADTGQRPVTLIAVAAHLEIDAF